MLDSNIDYSEYIPIWKYILLNIATFGIFQFVWIFRQWEYIYLKEGIIVSSVRRTAYNGLTFAPLVYYCYKTKDLSKKQLIVFTTIYYLVFLIITFLSIEFNNYFIYLISIIIYIPLINTQNNKYEIIDKDKPKRKLKLWSKIILGILFSISIISFFDQMNLFLKSIS